METTFTNQKKIKIQNFFLLKFSKVQKVFCHIIWEQLLILTPQAIQTCTLVFILPMIKQTNSSSLITMGTYKNLFITIYLNDANLIVIPIDFHSYMVSFSNTKVFLMSFFLTNNLSCLTLLIFTSLALRPNIFFAMNDVAKLSERPSKKPLYGFEAHCTC